MDCLFCKIIKGEIPSYKIYENEHVYAFLDIADDFYGHTIVVPKVCTKNILTAKFNTLNELTKAVSLIGGHFVERCGFDGVNVYTNANASAGQEVMHLHYHIIPRKLNDGVQLFSKQGKNNFDLAEVQSKLKFNYQFL